MSFLSKRAALPLIRAILWGGFCGRDTCELRSGLLHTQNGPWFMFCAPVPNKNHFQLLQTPRNLPHMFLHIRKTELFTRYGGVDILKGKFSQKWNICWKCTHPQVIQDADEFLQLNRDGEIQHCITCLPMDALQWMGAVRMRVQTAD